MAIKFTNAQMVAGVSDDKFVEWVVNDFMPENYPHMLRGVKHDVMMEMIQNAVHYANYFGFRERKDQIMFIAMMLDVGPDFWWFPGFKEIMFDQSIASGAKIDRIYELPNDVVEAAAYGSDPMFWFPKQVEDHPLRPKQSEAQ